MDNAAVSLCIIIILASWSVVLGKDHTHTPLLELAKDARDEALFGEELLILAVRLELREVVDELVPVRDEDLHDGLGLVRVGNKDFEDVERLELDCARAVAEELHHQDEVAHVRDVAHHHRSIHALEEEVGEKLERLSPERVVVACQEIVEGGDKAVVLSVQNLSRQRLVQRQQILKGYEGIRSHLKVWKRDVDKQFVKVG
mmetsp:Transcript_12385/g.40781  ORF Transcript_12385/g.40781 Transcript_12385/m.40781 type:complete len:201 (-) Transcript_12385:547-1149(-)